MTADATSSGTPGSGTYPRIRAVTPPNGMPAIDPRTSYAPLPTSMVERQVDRALRIAERADAVRIRLQRDQRSDDAWMRARGISPPTGA